ncbi:uncharacterized protein [Physcomitrium patens]|uniref:uncharacterized protein isoform X6 n=1 Tax=Physcomitrium patens TaxID=3218 RepID=UPI003CCD99FD
MRDLTNRPQSSFNRYPPPASFDCFDFFLFKRLFVNQSRHSSDPSSPSLPFPSQGTLLDNGNHIQQPPTTSVYSFRREYLIFQGVFLLCGLAFDTIFDRFLLPSSVPSSPTQALRLPLQPRVQPLASSQHTPRLPASRFRHLPLLKVPPPPHEPPPSSSSRALSR